MRLVLLSGQVLQSKCSVVPLTHLNGIEKPTQTLKRNRAVGLPTGDVIRTEARGHSPSNALKRQTVPQSKTSNRRRECFPKLLKANLKLTRSLPGGIPG